MSANKRDKKTFYITTTLPYVNAEPHIGFAMEAVRADVIARWKRLEGYEVFFNTGTDEHGAKIFESAKKAGKDTQIFVDEASEKFKALTSLLNLSEPNFIRTTDAHHIKATQEFWHICDKNGYIYKKPYKIKYCVGCELEKTDSELENGRCPIHPNRDIEEIEEENYFFKFSAFQKQLLDFYEEHPDFVLPAERYKEIKVFVGHGLQDFSISRIKEKMPWGIEVPGDASQVLYVWFDALVNYISAIGWPEEMESFNKWQKESGGMVQYCGKDNLRQQSAMWQAMLMAADLPNSKQVVIDGFITGEGGAKMSKSLGNVVSPSEIVKDYGTDALRYFFCRELHPFEDSPFSMERFKETYNANLANGLGNLVSRIMTMAISSGVSLDQNLSKDGKVFADSEKFFVEYKAGLEEFNLQKSTNAVWNFIAFLDGYIQAEQPFKKVKNDRAGLEKDMKFLLTHLSVLGDMLLPFLPETASKIQKAIAENKKPDILFPRRE